jgi:hypothetical protein
MKFKKYVRNKNIIENLIYGNYQLNKEIKVLLTKTRINLYFEFKLRVILNFFLQSDHSMMETSGMCVTITTAKSYKRNSDSTLLLNFQCTIVQSTAQFD